MASVFDPKHGAIRINPLHLPRSQIKLRNLGNRYVRIVVIDWIHEGICSTSANAHGRTTGLSGHHSVSNLAIVGFYQEHLGLSD